MSSNRIPKSSDSLSPLLAPISISKTVLGSACARRAAISSGVNARTLAS